MFKNMLDYLFNFHFDLWWFIEYFIRISYNI